MAEASNDLGERHENCAIEVQVVSPDVEDNSFITERSRKERESLPEAVKRRVQKPERSSTVSFDIHSKKISYRE